MPFALSFDSTSWCSISGGSLEMALAVSICLKRVPLRQSSIAIPRITFCSGSRQGVNHKVQSWCRESISHHHSYTNHSAVYNSAVYKFDGADVDNKYSGQGVSKVQYGCFVFRHCSCHLTEGRYTCGNTRRRGVEHYDEILMHCKYDCENC